MNDDSHPDCGDGGRSSEQGARGWESETRIVLQRAQDERHAAKDNFRQWFVRKCEHVGKMNAVNLHQISLV